MAERKYEKNTDIENFQKVLEKTPSAPKEELDRRRAEYQGKGEQENGRNGQDKR